MKKIFTLIGAGLLAMTANATLYIIGADQGWDPNNPTVVELNNNSEYVFTVYNPFKISNINPNGSWDTFNPGAKAPSTALTKTKKQTVALTNNSNDNINLPYGDGAVEFTVTINSAFTQATFEGATAPDLNAFSKIYIRGNGDWNSCNSSNELTTNDGIVYTREGVNITSAFKIADASWGSINYGYSGTFPVNEEKALVSGGGDISVAGMPLSNATVTFNFNKKTLLISVDEEAEPSFPEVMYVIGTLPAGKWNPAVGEEMTSQGEGVYVIDEVSIEAADGAALGYFGITAALGEWNDVNAQRFGPAEKDALAGASNPVIAYYGNSDTPSWSINPGKYKFTFSYVDMTLDIESLGDVDPTPTPETPSTLYMIGEVNGGSWTPTYGVEMSDDGDGFFSAQNVKIANGTDKGYFAFTVALGSDSEDWPTVNALRYGPATDGTEAVAEVENQFYVYQNNGSAPSWYAEPGIYDVTVSFEDQIVVIEKVGDIEPEPEPETPSAFYVMGSLTSGNFNLEGLIEMTDEGDGMFVAEDVEIITYDGNEYGYVSFTTVNSTDWNEVNANRYGPAEKDTYINVELNKEEEVYDFVKCASDNDTSYKINPGTYKFTVICEDGEMYVVMEMTAEPEPETPEIPETLYIIGQVNGTDWDPTVGYEMNNDGDGFFSLENVAIDGYFAFTVALSSESGNWDTYNALRYGPAEKDVEAVDGEETPFYVYKNNGDAPSWQAAPGVYTVTMSFEDQVLVIEKTGDITIDYPETMFVIGTLAYYEDVVSDEGTIVEYKSSNWDLNNTIWPELKPTDDEGVYSGSVMLGADGENSFFSLTTVKSTDWDAVINLNRFGPATDSEEVNTGSYQAVKAATAWKAAPNSTIKMNFDYKTKTLVIDEVTGVAFVTVDGNEAVEYFNLQGVRVANPESGLYIRRQGGTASKVYLK